VPAAVAAELRRGAEAAPRAARAALEAARSTRWTLQRLFADVAAGRAGGDALEALNELLSTWPRRLHRRTARSLVWRSPAVADGLDGLLGPVVWSAADLLVSEEASRIRVCGGPDCGWMYVDRSRNGLRRWCQMATCGTRAKSARRAARRDKGGRPSRARPLRSSTRGA